MKLDLLVADDHPVVCAGLRQLLDAEPDLRVTQATHDGAGTLQALACARFDLVLLDLNMPGITGLALVRAIRARVPAQKVLVLSFHNDVATARAALAAGANGFISKACPIDELLQAIRAVCAGHPYLAQSLMQAMVFGESGAATTALSPRQQQILGLLASGLNNRCIATRLGLSEKTVSTHRVRLSRQLDAKGLSDLMRHATRLGLETESRQENPRSDHGTCDAREPSLPPAPKRPSRPPR
jgi:DNA-binding NarL/FixJ family response regulator